MAPPPPPAKPSPHRFLIPNRKTEYGSPRQSLTFKEIPPAATPFTPTPRFTLGTSQRPTFIAQAQSSTASQGPRPTALSTQQREEVHDATPTPTPEASNSDEEMLDTGPMGSAVELLPPASRDDYDGHVPEPTKAAARVTASMHAMSHSPKRRRLDDAPTSSTAQTRTPRFIIPSAADATLTSTSTLAAASTAPEEVRGPARPAFLKASLPAPTETSEPLPDAFSPHRKGARFVAGGMAAELQAWIIEAGQGAVQARKGRTGLHGEEWARRIRVGRVQGEGLVFGEGVMVGGEEGKVMLIEDAGRHGKVTMGDVVGIRAPTWSVDVLGESWIVGIDWRIIAEDGQERVRRQV